MKKNFAIIFIVNMVLRIIMQGLLPLYPIITEKFGATKQENGYVLAASYSMLLLSTLLSGKLVSKFVDAKTLLIISVLPMCIGMSFLGSASTLSSFVFWSLLVFFLAGVNIITGLILISHFSNKESIGKNFGIIGLSNLLGSLIGGFVVGPVLQNFGYDKGFMIFGIVLFVTCCFTFFIDKPPVEIKTRKITKFRFSKAFVFALLSFVLAVMLIHVFLFSFSLSMKAYGFNISQISIYSALGTAMVLPFPFLFGKWTAKYNPKLLLTICYACMGLALLCLLLPKWTVFILLAVALMSILSFAGRAVIVALVFPWFTDEEMPMVQAYLGTAAWLAAIIGYLSSGFILQNFGLTITLFYGITVAVVSILILNLFCRGKAIAS